MNSIPLTSNIRRGGRNLRVLWANDVQQCAYCLSAVAFFVRQPEKGRGSNAIGTACSVQKLSFVDELANAQLFFDANERRAGVRKGL